MTVKPSDPEAKPRRDGWVERMGTWADVTVGSLLAGPNRTDVYEVVGLANGPQVIDGYTNWCRVKNTVTGEVWSIEPKPKTTPAKFLMPDDEAAPPPARPVENAEAIALLVQHLGAQEIATRDEQTGEVWCPDYASGKSAGDNSYGIEELEHLRICHGLDISGLESLTGNAAIVERAKIHGRLHSPRGATEPHGGFPHRHSDRNDFR
jgi:hypothetical protein